MAKKFAGKETVILGISPDAPSKQAKFKAKHDLPYTLLCDIEHKVAEAYGAWKLKTFMGRKFMGVERSTFVIDKKGKIAQIFEKVKAAGHAEAVLCTL